MKSSRTTALIIATTIALSGASVGPAGAVRPVKVPNLKIRVENSVNYSGYCKFTLSGSRFEPYWNIFIDSPGTDPALVYFQTDANGTPLDVMRESDQGFENSDASWPLLTSTNAVVGGYNVFGGSYQLIEVKVIVKNTCVDGDGN